MALALIFGPSGPVTLFLVVVSLGVPIWAVLDVVSHSRGDFYAAGSSRTAWIAVLVVATIAMEPIGFILSCVYLMSVRHKVRRIELTKFR
jgi:hypothetical protein